MRSLDTKFHSANIITMNMHLLVWLYGKVNFFNLKKNWIEKLHSP